MSGEAIVAVVMGALLVIQQFMWYRERKDLYSRIMARDLTDYANATGERMPPKSRNIVAAGIRRYFKQAETGE